MPQGNLQSNTDKPIVNTNNFSIDQDHFGFEEEHIPQQVSMGLLSPKPAMPQVDWSHWMLDGILETNLDASLDVQLLPQSTNPDTFNTTSLLFVQSGYTSKSLVSNPAENRNLPINSTVLGRIFSSYPAMMLRKETFPPFIHQVWPQQAQGKNTLLESLVNCMTISQLFVNRNEETNKFMWSIIRMELDRIGQQVRANHESLLTTCN